MDDHSESQQMQDNRPKRKVDLSIPYLKIAETDQFRQAYFDLRGKSGQEWDG